MKSPLLLLIGPNLFVNASYADTPAPVQVAVPAPPATTVNASKPKRTGITDAADYGFSPDANGVKNSEALQRAVDQTGSIVVSQPGTYKIAGTVFIGCHTSLVFGHNVCLKKVAEKGPFSHVLLNKGALTITDDYDAGNPELGWIKDGVVEKCHDLNAQKTTDFFAGSWLGPGWIGARVWSCKNWTRSLPLAAYIGCPPRPMRKSIFHSPNPATKPAPRCWTASRGSWCKKTPRIQRGAITVESDLTGLKK